MSITRDGVPVVLLHGVTDSWRSFEPVLDHLPAAVHAYALTQRGQGDASRPGSYRLDDLVDDVARSRLSVYSGAGHAMHWEEPERFAADVAEFAAAIT